MSEVKRVDDLFRNSELADIDEKVRNGERISLEDGVRLYNSNDILTIGAIADSIRQRRYSKIAYYVVNFHVNYSNICFASCPFCAFAKFSEEEGAFEFSVDEYIAEVKKLHWDRATELHIVGGLHQDLPFDYYLNLVSRLKEELPSLHIKAFTGVEIQYFSEITELSVHDVLQKLVDAGLDSLPGGGPEVLTDRLHRLLYPRKASPAQWLNVHRIAHEMGISTNATLLYGHIETTEEKVEHLDRLRQLEDEAPGFQVFIPLAYHPENNRLGGTHTTGMMDLKEIAIARIMLDNFPHIKAYWTGIGIKLAQVGLHFGADDLDGTVVNEKIFHMAGADSPGTITETDLRRYITEAGFTPVRRDTLFNVIDDDKESQTVAEHVLERA